MNGRQLKPNTGKDTRTNHIGHYDGGCGVNGNFLFQLFMLQIDRFNNGSFPKINLPMDLPAKLLT